MKHLKLLLWLTPLLLFASCQESEDDYCDDSCWTVVQKSQSSISMKISRNCSDDTEWKRIYFQSNTQLNQYYLRDVLCGNEIPNN